MTSLSSTSAEMAVLDGTNFRDYLCFIRPAVAELQWREIPWQSDLREGIRIAKEQGKPIFLWTMNGNPLGCT